MFITAYTVKQIWYKFELSVFIKNVTTYTVLNKCDLDSVIKTKTPILAS